MANDMVALGNGTTGTAVASVSFTSISGTYKDLFLVCDASPSSNNAILQISLNSNSPAMNRVYISGGSSTQETGSGASIRVAGSGASASTRFATSCSILDYAATNKGKVAIVRSGGEDRTNLTVFQQNTTSAITTITISFSVGNIQSGAFFALYGIN